MPKPAFAFEARGEFDGATTSLPDGSLVNIAERLANNNGRIETNDEQLAAALRGHPAVKEVNPDSPAAGDSKTGAKSATKEG